MVTPPFRMALLAVRTSSQPAEATTREDVVCTTGRECRTPSCGPTPYRLMKSPFRGIEPKTYVSVFSFGAIAGSGHEPARHGARMLLASPLPVYQNLTVSLLLLDV